MIDKFLLFSGNDIAFYAANLIIKQPKIKEIAYVGEENFFMGLQTITFQKEMLLEEDRIHLSDIDNFDIFMSILNNQETLLQRLSVTMVFALIFPNYLIEIQEDKIALKLDDVSASINRENFEEFQTILQEMFSLETSKQKYNPANEAAKKIAEKLKRGQQIVDKLKQKDNKQSSLFSLYTSILAIGLQMDLNIFLNHTVYQLFDEFKRFQLYQAFDINVRARMAGAIDIDEADNWMEDIHS